MTEQRTDSRQTGKQLDDEALDRLIAELPRNQQPAHDLWPGIALRLGSGGAVQQAPAHAAHAAGSRRWRVPLALAASLLVAAVAVALLMNVDTGMPGESRPLAGTDSTVAEPTVGIIVPAQLAPELAWQGGMAPQSALRFSGIVDQEYAAAMHEYRQNAGPDIGRVMAQLPAATVAQIDVAMNQFESAAKQIRAALEQDPDNMYLAQMLSNNHARQLRLLKQVAQMTV